MSLQGNIGTRRQRQRYFTFAVRDWGGLNEDDNPSALPPGDLTIASNCWRRGGAMGTRPGIEYDDDFDATATGTIGAVAGQGFIEYRRAFDATRDLVAIFNGKVYQDGANEVDKTTNSVTISAGQDNHWTFAEHANNLYAAGGAASDSIWVWDGTNPLDVITFEATTGGGIIDAKYIHEQWNYGFLAGMNGTTNADNPMVVRYSELGDLSSWPVENIIGGSSAIGGLSSYGGEYITGLSSHTDNSNASGWLLILTNRRIYSVLQTPDYQQPFFIDSEIANGCVGHNAFVPLGLDSGDAIYMSDRGIHSLRQSNQFGHRFDKYISFKIRTTFAGLNQARLKYTSGAYDPENGLVLFLVADGGATTQNLILALDVKDLEEDVNSENARWYKWRLSGVTANRIGSARDADGKRYIYLQTNTGEVGRFTTNQYQDFDSSGGYTVQWQTRHNDFGSLAARKGLGDISLLLQSGGNYKPRLTPVFDYGASATNTLDLDMRAAASPLWDVVQWDNFQWAGENTTIREKVAGWGAGQTIALRFDHGGTNEPFRVAGLSFQVRASGSTAEELSSSTE